MEKLRTCKTCKAEKPIDKFELNEKWRRRECTSCRFKKKNKTPSRQKWSKKYRRDKSKQYNKHWKNWKKKNGKQYSSNSEWTKFKRRNDIHYLPCVVCGNKSEAHHPDYSKPLLILYLCRSHHQEIHSGVISQDVLIKQAVDYSNFEGKNE